MLPNYKSHYLLNQKDDVSRCRITLSRRGIVRSLPAWPGLLRLETPVARVPWQVINYYTNKQKLSTDHKGRRARALVRLAECPLLLAMAGMSVTSTRKSK